MSTYIVSYDLNKPGQKYKDLYAALNSYGTHWHILDSTWIIVTTSTAAQVRDKLVKHLDSNDQILVLKSGGEAAWQGFDVKGTKWLKDHL